MLSIHRRLGLPSGLFPSGFPTNNLYTTDVITSSNTYIVLKVLFSSTHSQGLSFEEEINFHIHTEQQLAQSYTGISLLHVTLYGADSIP
jgi:hypothetical protein